MRDGRKWLVGAALLGALVAPEGASAAWNQPVGGASPINHADNQDGFRLGLAEIGGVPYVAWSEADATNAEVRVSRLNAAGSAWEQVVGGASPINHADNQSAAGPSLAAIGGVPYVAWSEPDATNYEIRVSRLNVAGTAWEQVVGGFSPINHSGNRSAFDPSLAAIGGVPYVAWREDDGTNYEVRVSRLNAAGTAWEQPVGGPNPINHADNLDAGPPSLAAINGVPYVAWSETDGTNYEVRVSRMNAAGTAWEQVVGGASPINQANNQGAVDPSLAEIGGVPYVAWREDDGSNDEVRVSRLNAAGTAWEQVVGGASPINQANNQDAFRPSLAAIGGVPYVAWREPDSTNDELRVSRLEPEFTAQAALPAQTSATFTADVHTYGIPYPIGFQYGPGLGSETPTTAAPPGSENVTITAQAGGLEPARGYQFRPFATAGVPAPRVLGAIGAFTTLAGEGGAPAFGARTLVTLRLAARRIPAKGPLKARVANANGFAITGTLAARTVNRVSVSRKRRITLKARDFRVGAKASKTVRLRLPNTLRRLLQRKRTLALRLTARVKDPAGNTRTVRKRVTPRLKKKLRQRR